MAITSFSGEYRFLSNFYPSDVEFEGKTYPTVEHAYQAAKSNDQAVRQWILESSTAGFAKQYGRSISARDDWQDVKLSIMKRLLEKKFYNLGLREKLLATGVNTLVEGNYWHDNTWGSCTCDKCGNKGENQLGKLLMDVRASLIGSTNATSAV